MAEVFWNPLPNVANWYVCPQCGQSTWGSHVCQPARAVAPMDPNAATRELARIATALERIADVLSRQDD